MILLPLSIGKSKESGRQHGKGTGSIPGGYGVLKIRSGEYGMHCLLASWGNLTYLDDNLFDRER